MTANYRSTRLLVEAINREMEAVRKAAMGNMALGSLNELRDLVAQLAKKAERTAVEDVPELAPGDYVATMKPLVAEYHRQLASRNLLADCLCMDLRVPACVLILVGDQGSSVRTAHDPSRPDAALVVETLLASLDEGTKKVAADAAAAKEAFAGIDRQIADPIQPESSPLTFEAIEEAAAAQLGCAHTRIPAGCPICGGQTCMDCRARVEPRRPEEKTIARACSTCDPGDKYRLGIDPVA